MILGARSRYDLVMVRGLFAAAALVVAGCDTGGLLVVEKKADPPPSPTGPAVVDFPSGGTVAKNAKYRVVFTVGQGTPNQAPEASKDKELRGGLVGAAEGE